MPNKYLDSVGLAEYTSLIKAELAPKNSPALTGTPTAPTPTAGDDSTKIATTEFVQDEVASKYLPLAGGTLTGNVYTTPYYDSTIVDPEGGQTLIVSKGKVAKGTAPSNNEWHTMVMAVDNSGSTNNANKFGQIETGVKTDGSVETTVQTYKNEANSTTSAKISVGYDANGNAFTSAPTPTAGDNSTKIATTAFVNTAMTNGYLPLSGGTMTGPIIKNGIVAKAVDESNTVNVYGGTGYDGGATIVLSGKSASNAGQFSIGAYDGTNRQLLTGKPDGTLTWNGNSIPDRCYGISLVSQNGQTTHTFTIVANSAIIFAKRGNNCGVYMVTYWDSTPTKIFTTGTEPITITKSTNSNSVTITNAYTAAVAIKILNGGTL